MTTPRRILQLLCIAVLLGSIGDANAAESAIELQPYRIRISVAFGDQRQSHPNLLAEIQHAAARTVGAMWALDLQEDRELFPVSREGLERLTTEQMKRLSGESDQAFFVAVTASGAGWQLAARGWQGTIERASPVVTSESYDSRDIAAAVMRLCLRLFQPIVSLGEADEQSIVFNLKAGEFPPPDPAAAPLQSDDVLIPFLIYRNRDLEVERIQEIPWTCLTVREVDRGRGTATIASGLRSPLGGKRRGRIEAVAIKAAVLWPTTRLRIVPQGRPAEPLVAHRIEVAATPPGEDSPTPPTVLLSDRRGIVRLAAESPPRVVWATVFSGKLPLARLPLVPGAAPEAVAELPDDMLRLQTEGELAILQDRLIEAVARRAGLIATIQSLAKAGKWEQVDAQLKELAALPEANVYLKQLTGIRVAALEKAQSARNRTAEARIRRLCDDMTQLIREYLNPDRVAKLREEVAELRKLDAADKAASERAAP